MAFEISKYLLMLKLGKQPRLIFFVQFLVGLHLCFCDKLELKFAKDS